MKTFKLDNITIDYRVDGGEFYDSNTRNLYDYYELQGGELVLTCCGFGNFNDSEKRELNDDDMDLFTTIHRVVDSVYYCESCNGGFEGDDMYHSEVLEEFVCGSCFDNAEEGDDDAPEPEPEITRSSLHQPIDTELLADCKANPGKYTTGNVVSLFRVKNVTETPKVDGFDDIVKKNMENQKRLQTERAKQNKSTLRSYRITRKG